MGPGDTQLAVDALRRGELVILPTETVYGLACDAANPSAVAAVFAAKGRPRFNPMIAHVTGLAAAERIVVLDDRARRLAQAFWPGPLTIAAALRDPAAVCDLARAGLDSIAVRAPDHPMAQAVLTAFGGAVAAPSANRSGRPSPTTLADALEETGPSAAAWIDGGPCRVGLESTVVGSFDGDLMLLRPGGITRAEIEAVSGPLLRGDAEGHRSPGRLTRHYAPSAPLRLDAEHPAPGHAFLAFGRDAPSGPLVWNLSASGDLVEAASNLFAFLRAADKSAPPGIDVAPIPGDGLGEAINDRLGRAAGRIG